MPQKQKKSFIQNVEKELMISPIYLEFVEEVKTKIRVAQTQATLLANQSMILLYYEIGEQILQRQEQEGWGSKVIEHLASDLQSGFPHLKGFSPRNLRYMQTFVKAYPDRNFVQSVISQLPWGHLIKILDGSSDSEERFFYIQQSLQYGWSQSVLAHHMSVHLYQRQGKALTNFKRTLAGPHAKAAQDILKDPYIFDFLDVGREAEEREIERGLLASVEKFLMELGKGFALVGRQYRLQVGEEEYYLDLLFYHTSLHCYIVVELKTGKFVPSDLGQLGFYLSAVDNLLRRSKDDPTIGLLLCRGKDAVVAEYALQAANKPVGVSTYEFGVVNSLPEYLKKELPTIEVLEQKLFTVKEKGA